MATIYWSGAIDTDIDDYRNYVTGENADPSSATIADNSGDFSGDNVIFQSLAVSNVSNNPTVNANETFNSIRIDSGSTLTGNASFSITVDGEADGAGTTTSGYAVDIDGALGTNVNLIITTADTTNLDIIPSSGNVHDLTINLGDAARIAKIQTGGPTLTGDLTITSGQLSTENNALTVTGHVSVTGTLTGGTSAISVGSMIINSGGTYSATSGTTTVTSENASHAFRCSGGGTYTNNDGTLLITTAAQTRLKMNGTGNVHHLTVNHASCQLHMESDSSTTVEGDLTITAGTVNTNTEGGASRNLTVTGAIDVASGGALTCNSSAVQCNGLRTTGGTVNLPDASGSFTVKGTEFSGYGIYDRAGSGNIVHNSGTVTWDTGGTSTMYALSTFNNITTTTSGTTLRWFSALTLAGTLTVAANTTVHEHSSAGGSFTVNGDVSVLGTLGDSDAYSAYSFGSLTINSGGTYNATSGTTTVDQGSTYVLRNLGTYTHNSGTLKVDRSSASGTRFLELGSAAIHKLVIDNTATTAAVAFVGVLNCAGDLEVTNGDFRAYGGSGDVTIDGHVTIANSSFFRTETSQLAAGGVNASLGSLQINSGATYDATPLTTTITSRTSGGYSWYAPTTGSTFNHNNGLVKLTYTSNETFWQGTGFYDLEIAGSTHFEHRYDDLTDGSGLTIFNNFTITEGRVRFNQAGDSVTVHGLTKMVSGQYGNTGTAPSGTHNYGNVVIEGGTWKVTSGTCNMSGIRKLGGTLA